MLPAGDFNYIKSLRSEYNNNLYVITELENQLHYLRKTKTGNGTHEALLEKRIIELQAEMISIDNRIHEISALPTND